MRIKFLDFKNEKQIYKKLKSYSKDLNNKFKNNIAELKDYTFNQEKFNHLISQLISDMNLDESTDNQEKNDEENKEKDKQPNSQNQEQKTKEKDQINEEMTIDGGIPDLENDANESDQTEEEVEVKENYNPDFKKRNLKNFGDIKYKSFTEEFDEMIKAEDLENLEELAAKKI